MAQPLDELKETPSQTAGPYVHIGLAPNDAGITVYAQELGREIAGPEVPGERIAVAGQVLDGTGSPLKDVLIEVWQADAAGAYPAPNDEVQGFKGWGRVVPDFETGAFRFETIKPGAINANSAPHLNLWLVARGINVGLNTRMYFEDEAAANAHDKTLVLIEQADRRDTLIARKQGDAYRFDIRLQGEDETVFFDV